MIKNIFDLPYSERKLVVFYDEEIDKELVESRSKILDAPATGLFPFSRLIALADIAQDKFKQCRYEDIGLKLVGKSQAYQFVLPPGHPHNQVVYVGHPLLPTTYSPFNEFHKVTLQSKFSELVSLLRHLGAKTIQAEHREGWNSGISTEMGTDIITPLPQVKANASINRSREQSIVFQESNSNAVTPHVPSNLVWYPHELTWQTIAEGRIQFGTVQFSLDFQYKSDYGINAKLAGKIQKWGFNTGGNKTEYENIVWHIKGNF